MLNESEEPTPQPTHGNHHQTSLGQHQSQHQHQLHRDTTATQPMQCGIGASSTALARSPTSDQGACPSTSSSLHDQTALPSFSTIGLSSLDLGLATGLSDDFVSELDNSFLTRQDISNRPGSCTSSDLASYHSPSTTETESLESYTSACGGWDFTDDDGLDVPDTFDLILESDGEANV